MKTAKYIKGNITPYFLSYTEKQAQTVYDFKTMLPLFIGNIADEPITVEEMKIYLNNNHPVISTEEPSNKQPTVMFKLAINVDGETFPVVLADWQVMGRPNQVEQIECWSVFSPNEKAIAVIRWKISDYKRQREERLYELSMLAEKDEEDRRICDVIIEISEKADAEKKAKWGKVPLLWRNDFFTAM